MHIIHTNLGLLEEENRYVLIGYLYLNECINVDCFSAEFHLTT